MREKTFLLAAAVVVLLQLPARLSGADQSADEQQLTKIEHDWGNAYVQRDRGFAQKITSNDFTFVGPDGNMVNKDSYVKDMAGDTVFTAFDIENLKIRVFGDSAVVVGVATIKAGSKNEDYSGRYSFTDTFVKQNGEWKAVAGHVTPVAKK